MFIVFLFIHIEHISLQTYIQEMIVKKERKSHSEIAHNFRNRFVDQEQLMKPSEEEKTKGQIQVREKIDEILGVKKEAAFGTNIQKLGNTTSEMVKFTSKGESGDSEKQRIARIDTVQIDPLMPPLHKHRKLPKGPGSPPPQLLRSPPRKPTKKDQQDWKVPPCISNWKNSKGYTIPIHMRIGAQGRALQHNTINEHFADNIDSLYIAERQSKLELEERARVQKSVDYKEYLKREELLREAVLQAREEGRRIQENQDQEEDEDYNLRENFRDHRRKELEREERLKKVGAERKKQIKKEERDISEKVALGQAQPSNQELAYDQRLYDKAGGLEAGNEDSEQDNLYDKPMFADRNQLYSGLVNTQGGKQKMRTQPVKFEKQKESVFGMDSLMGKPSKRVKRQ